MSFSTAQVSNHHCADSSGSTQMADRFAPQERGVAEMMVDVYRNWHEPLHHKELFHWHSMLMAGNRYIETVGAYRQHEDAMQIVSGRLDKPTIHFEAPASRQVATEMESFIVWFNQSWPGGKTHFRR